MEWRALVGEGKSWIARGKVARAAEVLALAAERSGRHPQALVELGIAVKLAGDPAAGREILQEALSGLDAAEIGLAQKAGIVLALTRDDLGDRPGAIEAFERVRAIAPDSPLGETALYYIQAYRGR